MKNPLKIPIPDFERKVERLKQKRAKLDKCIMEYEAEIAKRKALPDEIPEGA